MFELRLAKVRATALLRLCTIWYMRPEGVLLYQENFQWVEFRLFYHWTIEFSTLKRRIIFLQKVYWLKIALADRLDYAFM